MLKHFLVIFSPTTRIYIREDEQIGTEIITVRATDRDAGVNGYVTYHIVTDTDPEEMFSIDKTSGSIYVEKSLDYEKIPIYNKVKLGDYFITSGAEGLFPGGVKVGKVIEINENIEQQTLDIKLKNEEDFSRTKIGFIAFNKTAEEIKQHLIKK